MIGTLSWSLGTDSLTASTAVFVEEQPPTGTTARVRFTQNVNTFTGEVAEQTFTLTVSDGAAATQTTAVMLISKNRPPEILSIDGRKPPVEFVVASNLDVARFSAVVEDDFDTGTSLTWSVSNILFSTGENATLGFVVDGELMDEATGKNVMLELRRDNEGTTVTFVLVVKDSLGAEGSSGEVRVTVGDTVPAINPGDLPPITAGESGTFTFRAEDEGLGQKEGLNWEVAAEPTNIVVEFPSGNTGAEVEVTATLRDVRTRLDGSYVLRVRNSVGSISTRRVTVSRSNEPPVVSYQSQDQNLTFQGTGDTIPVRIVLPSGTATTQIELNADDPVGEPEGDSTFSWTITRNPPDDSDATFFVGSNYVTTASGSSVTVQFLVPEDLAGEDRTFTIQVSDGRGENAVSDIPVVVSRTTGQLFRIRMFLGGAAR